jgi:hypothetical protein
LFASLKIEFQEIGVVSDDPEEGERACAGLMLMTLKMLMPECKGIMETFAKKQSVEIASKATKESGAILLDRPVDEILRRRLFNEQQKRAAELIGRAQRARMNLSCELAWRRGLILSRRWRANPIHRISLISDFRWIGWMRGSMILTSRLTLDSWDSAFAGDGLLGVAMLHRILHHAIIVNIDGESFGLKDKPEAGLLAAPTKAEQ